MAMVDYYLDKGHDRLMAALRRRAVGQPIPDPWARSLLQERSSTWERRHKNSGSLLRGDDLVEVELWSQKHTEEFSPLQKEYLEASIEKQRSDAKDRERLKTLLAQQGPTLLYFNGVNPRGGYLTPPMLLRQLVEQLFQDWQAPPSEWALALRWWETGEWD
jgi:hypothetical protein